MKQFTFALILMTLLAVACSSDKKKEEVTTLAPTPGVTDIAPPPAPVASAPPQPVYDPATVTPAPRDTAPAAGGGRTYTVKSKDTLYGIARQHYGDGKQYTKIVAANPGLDPGKLKVGQTIVIP